ncbi:ABC transporter ATP-binding protein [Alteriqipengyuania flavescens]|uniref:ABC transporter ATP-binding protein n=1 Tax=Alteriqipengyuania flavescens TaxID=3053610 RepID=UPI0025B316E6|nr:ABC transporter ATP-binding protein [Alteriqipengyuania flavescens]WJY20070.1 ABC transporter ATP-binding protein [Alteriqipengyuania flavescens]WJY26013.1 ABC transporter ATP-binding protein [Alteriqipengyuania flavescens]
MGLAAERVSLAGRLRAVSATVKPGRITAICGPNGAGKSTLLSALAGLLAPDSGTVSLDGESLTALHPRERAKRIGYLQQDGEVAWDVAVKSLIALGRLPHRDPQSDRGEKAITRAMAALDLEGFAERPVTRLSGGEKVRALLARVLAGEPGWILADEPLAALDLAHQLTLLRHLKAEAATGAGVVIVLHDLALAMNHADRVLVLDAGRLVADGPPGDALSAETIRQVWQVPARWIGDAGARALVVSPPDEG